MRLESDRVFFNPVEWLAARRAPVEHIEYDPTLNDRTCQYRIIRGSTHDGTQLFEEELIASALNLLAMQLSYWKPHPPAEGTKLRYVVGPARLATVYGKVDLPVGRYPGERQRICVPVRCEAL